MKRTKIVVDTSTIIAVIAGETEKPRLIELTQDATIIAPPSIEWEVGNAFSAMLKRSRITLEQALEAIDVYQRIPVEILSINMQEAVRLAGTFNIYAYDAYIIQCAIEQDAPLISLDQNLIRIAKLTGIKNIEVHP